MYMMGVLCVYGLYVVCRYIYAYVYSTFLPLFLLCSIIILTLLSHTDESDSMTATRQNALIDGISRSTVIINFCNRAYQENMKCMFELKEARTMTPPKPIITLANEADPLSYSTKLFLDLTQIKTVPYADISGISTDLFDAEDVPSG